MIDETIRTSYTEGAIFVLSTFRCDPDLGLALNDVALPQPPRGQKWTVYRGPLVEQRVYSLQTMTPRHTTPRPNMRTIHNYHRHCLHILYEAAARILNQQGEPTAEVATSKV